MADDDMMYGLDIGGTKIELAIFDGQLNLKDSWRIATPKNDYQVFLNVVSDMIKRADVKTGVVGSVGIGLPGFVNNAGFAVSANVPCINGKPVVKDLMGIISRPVVFQNDINVFAVSEANGGAGNGSKHTLGVILGTGLGSGLCVSGELYLGKKALARESGHIPLPAFLQRRYSFPVRQCGCGLEDCVEQYLAGPGLLWMSSFFGGEYSSVAEFMVGVRDGEAAAEKTFTAYIDCLGSHLAQLTLMFDPEMIVLGGGLSNIPELYSNLPDSINRYLFDGVTAPNVVPPKFGDSSGVRGAAIIGRSFGGESN